MPTEMTPLQRAADQLLRAGSDDVGLEEWLAARVQLNVAGEEIARQLAEATDGAITVTGQAIRNWIRQFRDASEAVA